MAIKYKTKFGPQPIRDAVHRAGMTHNEFIMQMGIRPLSHTRLAMDGRCPPNEALRHRASFVLDLRVEELFTAEALAAVHRPGTTGPKPKANV